MDDKCLKNNLMKIRKAKIEDAAKLFYLFKNTVRKINSQDYTKKQIEAWISMSSTAKYRNRIKNKERYILVAENDIGVLGFGSADLENGKITGIFIRSNSLGNGWGKKILLEIEKEIYKHKKQIILDSSLTAEIFYLKNGYKKERKKEIIFKGVKLPVVRMKKRQ